MVTGVPRRDATGEWKMLFHYSSGYRDGKSRKPLPMLPLLVAQMEFSDYAVFTLCGIVVVGYLFLFAALAAIRWESTLAIRTCLVFAFPCGLVWPTLYWSMNRYLTIGEHIEHLLRYSIMALTVMGPALGGLIVGICFEMNRLLTKKGKAQ